MTGPGLPPIPEHERRRFDTLVDEAVSMLPDPIRDLLDEVPLIVIDEPDDTMLRELGIDPADPAGTDAADARLELCGLHSGVPDTELSHSAPPEMPPCIHLFRRGVVAQAGGWGETRDDGVLLDGRPDDRPAGDRVYEEIMITILHEIGHQFGLDEDDLDRLGYA